MNFLSKPLHIIGLLSVGLICIFLLGSLIEKPHFEDFNLIYSDRTIADCEFLPATDQKSEFEFSLSCKQDSEPNGHYLGPVVAIECYPEVLMLDIETDYPNSVGFEYLIDLNISGKFVRGSAYGFGKKYDDYYGFHRFIKETNPDSVALSIQPSLADTIDSCRNLIESAN